MDIFKGRYYKASKWYLAIIGLWPYQSNFQRRIGHFAWYAVVITLILPQLLLLRKEWGKDLSVTFENVLSIIYASGSSAKFTCASFRMPQLQILLNQIVEDWKKIDDKSEREILKKYSEEGRILVIFYIIYMNLAWLVFNLMPFLPYILDIVFPLKNGTRPYLFSFYADYIFFDQVDYHYWAVWHGSLVYMHSVLLFCGIDTIYVLTVKHACGLFAIIRYRLNITSKFKETNESIVEFIDQIRFIEKGVKKACMLHEETLQCCNLLEDSFSLCFLLVQCLCVLAISLIAVYLFHLPHDFYKMLRIFMIFAGLLIHLLCLNWVGQQIINSSERIFNSAEWYLFPLNVRKSINIIMTRSLYPCYLTAGSISILSMESFEMVLKTSASYFTVFLSVM